MQAVLEELESVSFIIRQSKEKLMFDRVTNKLFYLSLSLFNFMNRLARIMQNVHRRRRYNS